VTTSTSATFGPPVPGLPWDPTPLGPYADQVTVPVAWLGRTSTEDSQDPTLSLPRQLRNARAALPPGWVIVAHFYDVESGRKDLEARGRSTAHERFAIPIPRDGGIKDLLEEAQSPARRFAAVICESIERVARRTYYGTKIEHELGQSGVALCAADEPILTSKSAKRATPTLTRRVKQAVAEWYVLQMLEQSWDGFIEHIKQGWNIGKPPYGYLADKVPHPVPARRAEGRTKHRLVPDPVRGPVVTEIFRLRALLRLSYQKIADRLNLDLVKYPPPVANREDATIGLWTVQSVRGILENPKYTGYQVWNRKARKKGNKLNPVSEWIWSPKPVHEPLVTLEVFNAVWANKKANQGSRSGAELNTHPDTQRSYPLRSYVRCKLCARRMFGKTSKDLPYYVCYRDEVHHRGADWFDDHPKALWVSEKILLSAVHWFFGERISVPDAANTSTPSWPRHIRRSRPAMRRRPNSSAVRSRPSRSAKNVCSTNSTPTTAQVTRNSTASSGAASGNASTATSASVAIFSDNFTNTNNEKPPANPHRTRFSSICSPDSASVSRSSRKSNNAVSTTLSSWRSTICGHVGRSNSK